MAYQMQFGPVLARSPELVDGALNTLILSAETITAGVAIGMLGAAIRVYGPHPAGKTVAVYVEAFRNTPLLVQLFLIFFGLPYTGFKLSANMAAFLAISFNLGAYSTEGITWAMPFNVSDPVLFYNRKIFAAAGLDPDDPPTSLEEVRAASEAIVASGAASTGIALDSGSDSGGGWFLEQWFAKAGELYADNGNGRLAPATRVLFDGPTGVELLTYLQDLLNDGLAVNVGDNASGQDNFLKLAAADPAAMTIGTSAAIGQVLDVVSQGLFPNIALEDLGIGPMPGPGGTLGSLVGGASLWLVADRDPAVTAAAWDYVKFLVSAQSQSTWATQTGYVPVRSDALDLDPVKTTFAEDPRFAVAYEQLLAAADDPSAVGPVLGPLREVRTVAATMIATVFGGADPATALAAGAAQANALIADYAARN